MHQSSVKYVSLGISVTTGTINKCLPVLVDGGGYIVSAAWTDCNVGAWRPPPLLTTTTNNTSLTHHSFSLSLPFIISAARHLDLSVSVFRGKIYMCHVDSIMLPGLHPKSPE